MNENSNGGGANTILIVLVLVIVVGALVWFFATRSGGSSPEPDASIDVNLPDDVNLPGGEGEE